MVRYRTDAASTWTYAEASDAEWTTLGGYLSPWETPPPGTFYTAAIAAARHPLELETPEALNWGAPIRYTTSGPAQNLTVRASHNSVTVSWSKQPGTEQAYAHLDDLRGGGGERYVAEGDEPGTHTVTFNHLEPNSDHTIWIYQLSGDGRGAVSRSFRTEAAPPGWQPLPRGPQNLRATATHDTITVTWNPPFEGASPKWAMAMLDGEILVHAARISDGTTTWVSSGEVDSLGRYRIRPDTTYTIIVTHKGIRQVEQTITVTTQAAPPEGAARGSTGDTPVYRHPRLPFSAAWPLPMESRHYMVADPWRWRKSRYHVGLDTGGFHSFRAGEPGWQVHAVAGGVLRVFNDNPEATSYVLYCPRRPGALHQQIVLSGAQRMTDPTTGEVICNFLVSPASGRTALVFHDEHHVSKYAHLASGSSEQREALYALLDKDAGGFFIDPEDSVPVSRGAIVGLVGGSGRPDAVYVRECPGTGYDSAYCPHLHFELLRLDGTVDGDWFKRRGASGCTGREIVDGEFGYCGWSASRRMIPLLDPERYLEPLPASNVPRDPGSGTAIADANRGRRVFELLSAAPSEVGSGVTAQVSTAFWRPAFYSRFNVDGRFWMPRLTSVAGTRPGVTQYYTVDWCSQGQIRTPVAAASGEHPGEFARLERPVHLSLNQRCSVVLYTANPNYPPSDQALTPGPQLNRRHMTLRDPLVQFEHMGAPDGSEQQLSGHEFHFYRLPVTEGWAYHFCVDLNGDGDCADTGTPVPLDPKKDVVIKLWNAAGELVVGPDGEEVKDTRDGEADLSWTAEQSGTYVLSLRGGYLCGSGAPCGGSYTLYYTAFGFPSPAESHVLAAGEEANVVLQEPTGGALPLGFELFLLEMMGHRGARGSQRTMAQLPAGLSFDAAKRSITGTPTTVTAAQDYTLRATDDDDRIADLTVTIEVVPGVTIAAVRSSVTEGTSAQFTLTRAGGTTGALDVMVSVTETGDMIDGAAPTAASFTPGSPTKTLTVDTDPDDVEEENSTITATVTRTDDSGYALGTSFSASVTVRDNDGDDCRLTVTAGTGGTARGGGTSPCGSSRTATATANSGREFSHWTGDASGSANPVSIYLDRDKSAHAHFTCGTRPSKPAEMDPGVAAPTGVIWWTYPDADDVTYEWRELSRQPERRTVTWNESACRWDATPWQPDGPPIITSEATGSSKSAPKPDETRPGTPTPTGVTWWTYPDANDVTQEWRRTFERQLGDASPSPGTRRTVPGPREQWERVERTAYRRRLGGHGNLHQTSAGQDDDGADP